MNSVSPAGKTDVFDVQSSSDLECAAPGAPPRPPPRNACEAWDGPWGQDSVWEKNIREALLELEPGESVELRGSASIQLEAVASTKLKLAVERQRDGRFSVEVGAEGTAGGGIAKLVSASGGVASGAKFELDTAGEAADVCDALLKTSLVSVAGPSAALVVDLIPPLAREYDSARARLLGHVSQVSEIKADVVEAVQVGGDFGLQGPKLESKGFGAKASAQMRQGFVLDFKRGELQFKQSAALGAEAFGAMLPNLRLSGDESAQVSVTTVFPLPNDFQRKRGERFPASAEEWSQVARALTPKEVRVQVELETSARLSGGGTAELNAKMVGTADFAPQDIALVLGRESLAPLAEKLRFSVESQVSGGLGVGVSLGIADAEVKAVQRQRPHVYVAGSWAEASQYLDWLMHSQDDSAQRAAQNVKRKD